MAFLNDRKYSFVSKALSSETFAVVDVHGEEGLSTCYRFEVTLVTDEAEIDLGSVVQNPATFTIHRASEDNVDFHGILARFEQLHEVDDYVFYRAELVPKLWWLTLTRHNQVFLNASVRDLVEAVLKDGGLTALDFEFRLQGQYPKQEYVCQYGETHFNFMSRWLEREGIYYFFEQTPGGEKVVFTDTAISHTESPRGGRLTYSPPSGLGESHREEMVQGLVCRYTALPRKIRLKDYNYRKPSLEMEGAAEVDPKGRGEVYTYGEHFSSPEEGNRLAGIRAQELLCRKEEFVGDSTVPYVQPGYLFTLQDHYRESFDQAYLTVAMTHEGSQSGYLISGIAKGLAEGEKAVFYRNQFTAIPSATQFRPRRTAEMPRITGTLNARIDAAGSGQYAELDDQGRYKVILPFDLSGRKEGKASTWLRMIQPYAGADHGMHFPLHKGTEVLLTFIEGNPDRPVIAGAAPNPETPSPVTSRDQTMAKITTSGGNKIHMEDKEGTQRILLHTPSQKSFIRIGAINDPDEPPHAEWKGIAQATDGALSVKAEAKNEVIAGEETITILGGHMKTVIPFKIDVTIGLETGLKMGWERVFTPRHTNLKINKTKVNETSNKLAQVETTVVDAKVGAYETRVQEIQEAFDAGEMTNELFTEAVHINEFRQKFSSQVESLVEMKNEVMQSHDKIVEVSNTIAESVNTIAEAISAISETVTTITETNTLIAGEFIILAETKMTTAAEIIDL